jgi:hypothetical protein
MGFTVVCLLWSPDPIPGKSGRYLDFTGGTGVFPIETAPTVGKGRGYIILVRCKKKRKIKNFWSVICRCNTCYYIALVYT